MEFDLKYRNALNADYPGSYQIATRSGKTSINSGETLKFEQYITGYGNIQTAKIQAYISTDAFDLKKSIITSSLIRTKTEGGYTLSWGNQKNEITETGFTCLMAGLSFKGDDHNSTMVFDENMDSKNTILLCEQKVGNAPFEYTLKTKKELNPGDHYIDFYLTYFNGESWITSKERVPFKVKNFFEKHSKSISALALVASASGIYRFLLKPAYDYITSFL